MADFGADGSKDTPRSTSCGPGFGSPMNMFSMFGGTNQEALEMRVARIEEQHDRQAAALQARCDEQAASIAELRAEVAQAQQDIRVLKGFPPKGVLNEPNQSGSAIGASASVLVIDGDDQLGDLGGSGVSYYQFSGSMWDATVLCAFREVCMGDKLVLLFGGLCNIVLQGILLLVVNYDMLDNPVPLEQITHMLDWRATVGHSHEHFDDVKGFTQLQKLCNHSLWSFEQNEYEVMYQYLYKRIPGYTLSLLALILWVLTTTGEYRKTLEQGLAICNLPTVPVGRRCVTKEEDGGLRIIGIERWRRYVVLLWLLCRMGVVLLICIVGCEYLAQTVSLSDIVLNAVALAFVLDVDEQPFHGHVVGAANALCGGEYDFSYEGGTTSQSTVWLHNASDYHGDCHDNYRPAYHDSYSGDLFGTQAKETANLASVRRKVILNYAFSKGCLPGEILQPSDISRPWSPRICTLLPDLLSQALQELASDVTPGDAPDPARCGQFRPDIPGGGCPAGGAPELNGEVCLWSALSHKCEGAPPGHFRRWACAASPARTATWDEVEKACSVWEGFNLTSPYYNCRIIALCNDTKMLGDCFVMRGDVHVDMFDKEEFKLDDFTSSQFVDTVKRAIMSTAMVELSDVTMGVSPPLPWWWTRGELWPEGPVVGPQPSGTKRISMHYSIHAPVTFRPEDYFGGDYAGRFKQALLGLALAINASVGSELEEAVAQVSFGNTQFLSEAKEQLEVHARDNSPNARKG